MQLSGVKGFSLAGLILGLSGAVGNDLLDNLGQILRKLTVASYTSRDAAPELKPFKPHYPSVWRRI